MTNQFVKSAMTSVPVSRSQGELEKILRRYGCSGFGVSNDYENMALTVHFVVVDSPEKDAPKVPIRLELDIRNVYDQLYGRPMKTRWIEEVNERVREWDPSGYRDKDIAQAERVAWRQLILWVDAACSAAAAGVQKMSEAFFAHTVIQGPDGVERRLVEEFAGGRWQNLLSAGDEPIDVEYEVEA